MKKTDLERLVTGVKTPPLDRKQTRLLVDDVKYQEVAQSKPQSVAQVKPQPVAQAVAQGSWVAQNKAQKVAQPVAQRREHIQSTVAAKEVEVIKEVIGEMVSTDERKSYLKSLGVTIKVERRSNGHYFYGIKKFDGKKERFYCGKVI